MAKKESSAATPESNIEGDSTYIQEDLVAEGKASWFTTRAAKITAIAVGSSLALGAAFAGGAVAGQLAGGDRSGKFGMSQSGPESNGGPDSDGKRHGGPEGQRPQHNEGDELGERGGHDGPKSFVPPMQLPTPSSTTAP